MTETTHTRSRRASLGGLVVQLAALAAVLTLSFLSQSEAMYNLVWYLLGGVPIWFVTLLVFRQRELAALEALDLEELRREKQATGGGEAMFGQEGGGGLAFRVAEARLHWMQRWLIPGFGLATAAYLAVMGIVLWRRLASYKLPGGAELTGLKIGGEGWPALTNVGITLVILAIVMLGTFLLSRYTSGMGRVRDWQLLRGCGSYMLGNALAIMILMVSLGVAQYTGAATWEQTLAYILPVVMVVLALEVLINYVLDVYRPRAPGVEPRACFDSRLLGLIAEPGSIASSITDALNYQFGFQVSQTWFYQLLERWFARLMAAGALALWLLTCIVIVQPYEQVIIEQFGRQLNPGGADGVALPLEPGLHFKWPWPIEIARHYNTGQLNQLSVGFEKWEATPKYEEAVKQVQLWTDPTHLGLEHFDFMICPTRSDDAGGARRSEPAVAAGQGAAPGRAAPVHLIRMEVVVQYRIWPDRLHLFTQAMTHQKDRDVNRVVRDMAWEEVTRFNASATVEQLMGTDLGQIGRTLRQRISRRVQDLGLEVVYVGVTNIHPELTVANAYREVIGAEQQKTAAIREARVTESQRLSAVAGDVRRARALVKATDRGRQAYERQNAALQALRGVETGLVDTLSARLMESAALFRERLEAQAHLDDAREIQEQVVEDYALGLGQTFGAQVRAAQAAKEAEARFQAASAALEQAVSPLRAEAARRLTAEQVEALLQSVAARVASTYWDSDLDHQSIDPQLGGEAARTLAVALADRYEIELSAAGEVVRAENEREAYRAAPEVFKTRRLIEVLIDGMKDARKYFLAFDPGQRTVRVRFVAEDTPGMEPIDWGKKKDQP